MNRADLAVIWASLVLSLGAAALQVRAAVRALPALRPWHAVAAVLAAAYSISYVWLLAHIDRPADWSEAMRPVGMLSWPLVWGVPALVSVRAARRVTVTGEALAQVLRTAADEIRESQ